MGVDGMFNEDVLVEFSEGEYMVDVIVMILVGNSFIIIVIGEIDIMVLIIIFDFIGLINDDMLVINGDIDVELGVIVILDIVYLDGIM